MDAIRHTRRSHFALLWHGVVLRVLSVIWLVYGIFVAWRDEFVDPADAAKWRVLKLIPHLPFAWWVAISTAGLLLLAFEASFRLHRADLKKIDELLADCPAEIRSNVYSKVQKLPPEVRRELYRVVTAEIEADQLNVGVKSELEKAGFIKPAFAYTPAEFIERYRPIIVQWFKQNPL